MNKLKSRKFWIAVAAFLGSIATTIGGLTIENEAITIAGIICGAASAAIYAAAEAYVDGASLKSSLSETVTTVTATANSKETVERVLMPAVAVATDDTKPGGTD